jgi:hypothetical protein
MCDRGAARTDQQLEFKTAEVVLGALYWVNPALPWLSAGAGGSSTYMHEVYGRETGSHGIFWAVAAGGSGGTQELVHVHECLKRWYMCMRGKSSCVSQAELFVV